MDEPIRRIGGRLWLPVFRKGLRPPPWPLLVFQHGHFSWSVCGALLGAPEGYPWSPGAPFLCWNVHRQSFTGFDELGRHLASHGVAFFSQDCREAELLGAFQPRRDIHYRANLMLSAIESLRYGAGVPIDPLRIAIGGHSNGGAAAFLAQGANRAQDLGFAIRAIVAADHNEDAAGPHGDGDVLGLTHVLALTGGWTRPEGADELWSAHSTLGRLVAVQHEQFNHLYLNRRWIGFAETPGGCDGGSPSDYGPLTPGAGDELAGWMNCYVTPFLLAALLDEEDQWNYLRADAPHLPLGQSRVVSITHRWPLGDLL